MCKRVLFPAPDSPTMASISPRFTSNDRFSKSTRSDSPDRKTFARPSTRSINPSLLRCMLHLFRSKGVPHCGIGDRKLLSFQYANVRTILCTNSDLPKTVHSVLDPSCDYNHNSSPILFVAQCL